MAPAAQADPPFGVETFSNRTIDINGALYTQAGGHPDRNATEFSIPLEVSGRVGVEQLNGAYVSPPLGFIGNPAAAPRCPLANVKFGPGAYNPPDFSDCPPGSLIGIASPRYNPQGKDGENPAAFGSNPLYNLVPERGYPAQFGFRNGFLNIPTVISAFPPRPRTESYALTVGVPNVPAVNVSGFIGTFCSYGAVYTGETPPGGSCNSSFGSTLAPFLSNPVDCSDADPRWSIAIGSYEHAGALRALGIPDLADPDWKTATDPAPPVTGCEDLVFDPSLATTPLQNQGKGPVQADQPTGLRVALDFPQTNDPTDVDSEPDPNALQTPPPKDITVKLPAGLAISPSSADGLGACSDQAPDDQVHYDTTNPVTCPDASKIGTATALSPLLALHEPNSPTDKVIGPDPIPGDVYLLKPHPGDLPIGGGNQDGKFRLLIQLENPRYGVNIKLPGIATADKNTGQLTTVFTDNPQLPASHLTVDLKTGPRAPLATPVTCGNFTTTANLVPWGTPGVPDANKSASFNVGSGPNGSGCANTPGQRPFAPALVTAGTDSAVAGASSPFTLKLTRNDGEGELGSLELTAPKGFAAKLAGVPYCPEAAIASAAIRSGAFEQASPSCPAASQIGTLAATAGPGPNPYQVSGKAYLAGPYKGAPLSFVFIAPAVAGPFDLGSVVVRAAILVDPVTAQMTVRSDPLPRILDGMPLRLRSILARIDRPNFTRNPTNCEPMAVNATVAGSNGAGASPSTAFEVGGCRKLGFKPKLALRFLGPTHRSAFPKVRATLRPRQGDANIAGATVTLPRTEFLENAHIRAICTRARYAAGTCPAKSIYGHAKVWSPLLDQPLEGPVYLRASDHTLPDLAASLDGQFHIDAVGRIDSVRGRIRATLQALPDVPVSKFVLTMDGGSKGLLVNNTELCKARPRAGALLEGQNGKLSSTHPPVAADCGKK